MMTPVKELEAILNSMPKSRFVYQVEDGEMFLQRAGMQAAARNASETLVEVCYEHALHEKTRVKLSPVKAANLIVAIMSRDQLCLVEVPSD